MRYQGLNEAIIDSLAERFTLEYCKNAASFSEKDAKILFEKMRGNQDLYSLNKVVLDSVVGVIARTESLSKEMVLDSFIRASMEGTEIDDPEIRKGFLQYFPEESIELQANY